MNRKVLGTLVWGGLTVLIVFVIYKYTDWIKPTIVQSVASVKTVIAKVPAGPFSQTSNQAELDKAREAFANGNVDGSIAAYKAYLKIDAKNADAQGELGNVFYLTGHLPEAAQSYYEASKLLIEQKQTERVPPLLPIIGQVNPSLADELAHKLASAPAPAAVPATANAPVHQAPQSATGYY
jgi:thioredoxin-like negative regulator of GroEL